MTLGFFALGFLSGIDRTNCLIGEPLPDHTPKRHSGAAFVIHAKDDAARPATDLDGAGHGLL
jgi:hypothetical protein